MMTMNKSQLVFSHLPDLVHQCEEKLHRQAFHSTNNEVMKITCKQIAHSLRLVADQVDRKYCQDREFNRNLNYLSIRLVLQSVFSTLLSYILLFCKTKAFF